MGKLRPSTDSTQEFLSEPLRLELKALTPVIPEGELQLVVIHIEAVGKIHAPPKLKFTARRHLFYWVEEKIYQGRNLPLPNQSGVIAFEFSMFNME